ncbi:MAG: ATP synthase subunit I [Desulfosarcina sp.]|nr:ATP synthase subunit I [Desulfobacterales bacterium]
METIRQTQKKYCSAAIITAIAAGLVLILTGLRPFGKGLILGTLFSIINFILIGETIPMKIGVTKKKAIWISLGSIYFRYIILAVPLFLAIKMEDFNLIAVILGVFSVQLVILADNLFLQSKKDRFKR